jgi:hypothetical protein
MFDGRFDDLKRMDVKKKWAKSAAFSPFDAQLFYCSI